MKTYSATYSSVGNFDSGDVIIKAHSIVEAQDKFFAWLKTKDLYQHMWQLNMTIREYPSFEVIE